MSKKDFERLLDPNARHDPPDWEEMHREWISHVKKLYEFVEGALYEYKDRANFEVKRKKIEITEESFGTYETESIEISVGGKQARLVPIGSSIIGASGRVDVIGPAGRSTLVLVPGSLDGPRIYSFISASQEEQRTKRDSASEETKQEALEWKVATEPPNIRYLTLNEDLFFDVLVEVLGGSSSF